MAAKNKSDVKVLKGQDAEDKVLEYVKRMNRPYGAVDVSANLKGVVPKIATQKILVALAEKGELVQKTYGKTTFFVANQANVESVPPEKIKALEAEYKYADDENKTRAAEIKSLVAELNRLKSSLTDEELNKKLTESAAQSSDLNTRLKPLRAGTAIISQEALAQLDTDWTKWRSEWVRRKRIFTTFWQLATDALTPTDAETLAEDLGIEFDTPEHLAMECSSLCATNNGLKRKRN